MIISGLKKDRIVAKGFARAWIDRYRSIAEWTNSKPWSNTNFGAPYDPRIMFFCATLFYLAHYYQYERCINNKHRDAALQKRWGPTVDDIKRKLTPAEQVIIRNYRNFELLHGLQIEKHDRFRPEGCPLPTYEEAFGVPKPLGHH